MSSTKTKDRTAEDGGGGRPRHGLGRGLAALLADPASTTAPVPEGRDHRMVQIEFLRPNPRNPRRHFAPEDLGELAESIRAKGIIQPIIVRAIPQVAGSYEIVAGERRWRAAQVALLTDVPVIVIEADDRESLAFALIENVQRADLNAVEEATAYERLMDDFGCSQADLSGLIGKSRSHVANTVRLLKLPPTVLDMVAAGSLSAGHARALLAVADPEGVAARVVAEGLTVRDVEALAQREAQQAASAEDAVARAPKAREGAESRAIAAEFTAALGLAVSHHVRGDARELRIRYSSPEELAALRAALGARPQT